LLKQKSRKEIMPGEKLTYEKIKSFDESERLKRQKKAVPKVTVFDDEDDNLAVPKDFDLFSLHPKNAPKLAPVTSLFMGNQSKRSKDSSSDDKGGENYNDCYH
jgi:hypothetical protein